MAQWELATMARLVWNQMARSTVSLTMRMTFDHTYGHFSSPRRELRRRSRHDDGVDFKRSARLGHVAAGLVAVALAIGACGSQGAVDEKASGFGPLSDLFGSPEDQLEQGAKVEDAIRSCMVRLGWEYTPVDQSRYLNSWDKEKQDKYIGEFGYGITTYVDQPQGVPTGPQIIDPNQKYVEKLSERERNSYYADLYGPPDQFANGVYDPMTAKGCQNEAQRSGGGALWMNQKFQEDLNKAYSDIETDPRMQDARTKWSACMRTSGFEYENNDEIYQDLQKRLGEIMGTGDPNGGPGGEGVIYASPVIGGDGGPGGAPTYDKKKLKALQAEELSIAKADQACLKKHVDKVRADLEAEVVDQLKGDYPTIGASR
jgi:hypothetical protein